MNHGTASGGGDGADQRGRREEETRCARTGGRSSLKGLEQGWGSGHMIRLFSLTVSVRRRPRTRRRGDAVKTRLHPLQYQITWCRSETSTLDGTKSNTGWSKTCEIHQFGPLSCCCRNKGLFTVNIHLKPPHSSVLSSYSDRFLFSLITDIWASSPCRSNAEINIRKHARSPQGGEGLNDTEARFLTQ